ncbi:MAG TPA: sugar nucleotide-binding protein [Candidatus Limnocylindria bacterium]|nr:sugar nucleotide-binding protein [Candidatus Limnocylindria bacterium]
MTGRVLLIGAAGLVGRHVRAALADRDVVATFHSDPVDGGERLDITDAAAVRRLVRRARPDAVILAAADPYVERCERDPAGTRRVNVDAAATLRAAAADATLVVFSSEYVFDGTRLAYREDDAVAPLNEYGRQKVALEEIARSSPKHLVLRISGVFGDEPRRKNFVWQLVDRLRAGGTFDVPSDQLITPTDAASLGTALRELLDAGATGTFHAAGPEIVGRAVFAGMVARAFGLDETLIRARPTAELGLLAKRPAKAGLADATLQERLGHGLRRVEEALADLAASAG